MYMSFLVEIKKCTSCSEGSGSSSAVPDSDLFEQLYDNGKCLTVVDRFVFISIRVLQFNTSASVLMPIYDVNN